MKTLLVPVDFTPTSENTVNFAAEWSRKYEYKRIILLKTFYDSMFENLIVSAGYSNINQDNVNRQREEGRQQLRDLCTTLSKKIDADVKVTTAISEAPLLRGIIQIIQDENPEMIMLGTDNYNYSSGSFIAGNVISIAKASPIRVLLVPVTDQYKPVEHALLPYNLNMVNDLERLKSLKTSPQWNNLKLHVLNFGSGNSSLKKPEKLKEAEEKFDDLLRNFEHEIHFTPEKNVITAIANFTEDHNVQLIIALPGKHSFLYTLTHESISEAIYRNARLPVLILK